MSEVRWIDSHAHIYAEEFSADRDAVIERAREGGVTQLIMPNVDDASIDGMMEAELRYNGFCVATMGLHPCYVKKDFQRSLYSIESWLSKRKFAAIGEVGTDLYWDTSMIEQQKEALDIQAGWSVQYQLPLIIHCRESIDLTIAQLAPWAAKGARGVFHCFSGSLDQARQVISMGFSLGIGGVSTFKKGGLDMVLPHIEPAHVLLETDCPYLAPVPHRGKRNEPGYIPLIAERVSALMGLTLQQLSEHTTSNANRLFNIG